MCQLLCFDLGLWRWMFIKNLNSNYSSRILHVSISNRPAKFTTGKACVSRLHLFLCPLSCASTISTAILTLLMGEVLSMDKNLSFGLLLPQVRPASAMKSLCDVAPMILAVDSYPSVALHRFTYFSRINLLITH
jgi:hypothetical protein